MPIIFENDEGKRIIKHRVSEHNNIYEFANLKYVIDDIEVQLYTNEIHVKLDKSDYSLVRIMESFLNFNKRLLVKGGDYVELPKWIANKKAIINNKAKDNMCFVYAVTIALHANELKPHPERIIPRLASFANQYDWSNVKLPESGADIQQFEKNNKQIAVNVYSLEDNELCTSQDTPAKNHT